MVGETEICWFILSDDADCCCVLLNFPNVANCRWVLLVGVAGIGAGLLGY